MAAQGFENAYGVLKQRLGLAAAGAQTPHALSGHPAVHLGVIRIIVPVAFPVAFLAAPVPHFLVASLPAGLFCDPPLTVEFTPMSAPANLPAASNLARLHARVGLKPAPAIRAALLIGLNGNHPPWGAKEQAPIKRNRNQEKNLMPVDNMDSAAAQPTLSTG